MEASATIHSDWERRWAKYSPVTAELREALAAEPAWRVPMEKAFAAPRMDLYTSRQFALDRQVLQEQGLDRPDMLLVGVWSQQLPDFYAIKLYEDFQLKDVGKRAEEAGRTQEALAAYWTIARFGERLQTESSYLVQLFSVRIREDAYKRMLPLLRREGRAGEAAAVEAALSVLPAVDPNNDRRHNKAVEASAGRSARIVQLAAFLLIVFGAATVVWLISAITLRWRPNLSRGLNRMGSVLCFAPSLLFLAGLTLLVAYYPYAQPIDQFASNEELIRGYVPFLANLYSVKDFGIITEVGLARMFWPFIWCAAVAIAGALLLWWVARRERPGGTGVA